ncbi:nucleoside 2-deoxyribosyltransferase [Paenibacillus albicereus]|uniref:Nucleoside 2-deoxyribosyltransferase n=1 Tax=Paenibacillus albicereus TaxID=2726185 RepID=A0A6H2GVM9_9BACL|nr:nucleoside 2-deoxyribosyltransferase [Paenibacillus albicereus]QJC51470.1 nucleoside 2-deoxyribosyltransferase [Paenibacillus albicereus]
MNSSSPAFSPSVYLAGFEVFRPDAAETGRAMKALCAEYGFRGIFPLDKDIRPLPDRLDTARAIFEGNVRLVRQADFVLANLNAFRGSEPDAGTVFECGLAYALGKPLYGHLADTRDQAERLAANIDPITGRHRDGMNVENFGLPVNLMLAVPATVVQGGLEDALRRAADDLASGVLSFG